MPDLQNPFAQTAAKVCVIGLGYVGLPLAVALAAHNDVIGFDLDAGRVEELKSGHDRTLEVDEPDLTAARRLTFTDRRVSAQGLQCLHHHRADAH